MLSQNHTRRSEGRNNVQLDPGQLYASTKASSPGDLVCAVTQRPEELQHKGDIFWREGNTGTLAIWELYGFEVVQAASLGVVQLGGCGDGRFRWQW
jgi:hypothetical protein